MKVEVGGHDDASGAVEAGRYPVFDLVVVVPDAGVDADVGAGVGVGEGAGTGVVSHADG